MNKKGKPGTKKYNEWYREYREKNREKIRAYNRNYNKAWRDENGYNSEKRYKKKNLEKYIAQQLLNRAIYSNRIKRMPCEVCGAEKAQGHHDDYFKPLEVRWLCPIHHAEHHRKFSTGN